MSEAPTLEDRLTIVAEKVGSLKVDGVTISNNLTGSMEGDDDISRAYRNVVSHQRKLQAEIAQEMDVLSEKMTHFFRNAHDVSEAEQDAIYNDSTWLLIKSSLSIRQQLAGKGDERKVQLEVTSKKTNKKSLQQQGDLDMYSTINLVKRRQLLFDLDIVHSTVLYWDLCEKEEEDGRHYLEKMEFVRMMVLMVGILAPELTPAEAMKIIQDDWKKDAVDGKMSFWAFHGSLVELADHWTHDVSTEEYITFLDDLFKKITRPKQKEVPEDDSNERPGSRLSVGSSRPSSKASQKPKQRQLTRADSNLSTSSNSVSQRVIPLLNPKSEAINVEELEFDELPFTYYYPLVNTFNPNRDAAVYAKIGKIIRQRANKFLMRRGSLMAAVKLGSGGGGFGSSVGRFAPIPGQASAGTESSEPRQSESRASRSSTLSPPKQPKKRRASVSTVDRKTMVKMHTISAETVFKPVLRRELTRKITTLRSVVKTIIFANRVKSAVMAKAQTGSEAENNDAAAPIMAGGAHDEKVEDARGEVKDAPEGNSTRQGDAAEQDNSSKPGASLSLDQEQNSDPARSQDVGREFNEEDDKSQTKQPAGVEISPTPVVIEKSDDQAPTTTTEPESISPTTQDAAQTTSQTTENTLVQTTAQPTAGQPLDNQPPKEQPPTNEKPEETNPGGGTNPAPALFAASGVVKELDVVKEPQVTVQPSSNPSRQSVRSPGLRGSFRPETPTQTADPFPPPPAPETVVAKADPAPKAASPLPKADDDDDDEEPEDVLHKLLSQPAGSDTSPVAEIEAEPETEPVPEMLVQELNAVADGSVPTSNLTELAMDNGSKHSTWPHTEIATVADLVDPTSKPVAFHEAKFGDVSNSRASSSSRATRPVIGPLAHPQNAEGKDHRETEAEAKMAVEDATKTTKHFYGPASPKVVAQPSITQTIPGIDDSTEIMAFTLPGKLTKGSNVKKYQRRSSYVHRLEESAERSLPELRDIGVNISPLKRQTRSPTLPALGNQNSVDMLVSVTRKSPLPITIEPGESRPTFAFTSNPHRQQVRVKTPGELYIQKIKSEYQTNFLKHSRAKPEPNSVENNTTTRHRATLSIGDATKSPVPTTAGMPSNAITSSAAMARSESAPLLAVAAASSIKHVLKSPEQRSLKNIKVSPSRRVKKKGDLKAVLSVTKPPCSKSLRDKSSTFGLSRIYGRNNRIPPNFKMTETPPPATPKFQHEPEVVISPSRSKVVVTQFPGMLGSVERTAGTKPPANNNGAPNAATVAAWALLAAAAERERWLKAKTPLPADPTLNKKMVQASQSVTSLLTKEDTAAIRKRRNRNGTNSKRVRLVDEDLKVQQWESPNIRDFYGVNPFELPGTPEPVSSDDEYFDTRYHFRQRTPSTLSSDRHVRFQ
mmetsp:Transcript_46596/g.91670  ORF Transcript_46596/g.91670 Transcript_46596/m.91670 type:complete len:1391 (-) Transcript_46596:59-4231(-)